MVDAQLAEKRRIRAERERSRKARARSSWPSSQQAHHAAGRQDGRKPYSEFDFVMWDGEAPKDTGYSLFGSSLGDEICKPHLSTEDCFNLLLTSKAANPETIFVIFGGRYDFDEICRQSMPLDRLARLKETGHVTWHGYTIKQAEGKFFTLKRDGITVTVYEIFGWFHKAYVKALSDYRIGSEAERAHLSTEKARRAEFLWSEIGDIREYWQLELKLGPILMDRIREICLQAGFNPRHWYGPSALALEALRRNRITDYMGKVPEVVKRASQYAYAGGRFEGVRGGILGPVYTKDKNSAYMWAALDLPDLAHGTWRRGKDFEPGKFGLYHIRYNGIRAAERKGADGQTYNDPAYVHPLFCRHKNGMVDWPARVEGWYWAPEAELVKDSPYATFIGAYIFDEDNPRCRPFEFVADWFGKRLLLESLPESNPSRQAGKAFKWALASVYGQLARTVGWDRFRRTAPRYHQLEWAGYITSKCRAEMWRLAQQAGDKLISIDTDSVTAMCPLDVEEGKQLGQWKSSYADSGVFFQSGVYALKKDGEWIERKARGVEEDVRTRRLPISPEMIEAAIRDRKVIELKPRTRYVSIRMALNHQLGSMGDWREHPGDKLAFGGNGKRIHREGTCYYHTDGRITVCESAEVHVFSPRPAITHKDYAPGGCPKSEPHLLPWKDDTSGQLDKNLIADILWIDPERIDVDDDWIRELLTA